MYEIHTHIDEDMITCLVIFPLLSFADLVVRVTANSQRIFTNHFGYVLIIVTKFILFTNENN